MNEPAPVNPPHWRRAIRPLVWWGIMVLLMFAYRTHQRLSAQTDLRFDAVIAGSRDTFNGRVTLDGKPFRSGSRVSIGRHWLQISHEKARPFSTNFFIWYGGEDLGRIHLERARGELRVFATPPAERLTVRGPEFSTTLTNSPGATFSVPTDRYTVQAHYRYWEQTESVTIGGNETGKVSFQPKFGALRVGASHSDVAYELRDGNGKRLASATLPATVENLPEGDYQLIARRKDDRQEIPLAIKADSTNEAHVNFVYGAAVIESEPEGAIVMSGRTELGVTPLLLPELRPGEWKFAIRLTDYEEALTTLTIAATKTNRFRTNLVNRFYFEAITRARRSYDEQSFRSASELASEALRHKPDDEEARQLLRLSNGQAHLVRANTLISQRDYGEAIKAATEALAYMPESTAAKLLLDDLKRREAERIESEKQRQAALERHEREKEVAAQAAKMRQQRLERLTRLFNDLNRGYNNAPLFANHELISTNEAASLATAINNALVGKQPVFEVVQYDWPQVDFFTIQARQRIGIGYREVLIVGGQMQDGETKILWKVFEYESPLELKLLNGFLIATTSIKVTSQDPQVEQRKVERFQQRIKEGVELVKVRILTAIQ